MDLVPAILDSHIRVDGNRLGRDIVDQIFDEVTVENSAKVTAKNLNRWGWEELPDKFILAELDGDTLIMPRGYAFQFKLLLREHGMNPWWIDKRTWNQGNKFRWRKEFIPREHQPTAKSKMRHHEQGIYEAPTGSGKSLTCIWLIQELSPRQSIILVDKLDLLNQWVLDIDSWIDTQCGVIGGGKWDDKQRITIATVQSIWSAVKKKKIDERFFKRFSLVIADECHHTSADSIKNIIDCFSARFRLGVSATPDRLDDKFEITQSVLGEVFHKDDEELLRERGVLVRPHVEVIRTDFKFNYWPTHKSDEDNECQVPNCKLNGQRPHSHQDNYQKLKAALVSDTQRNNVICKSIWNQVKTGPHHHLVITDEIRHVEAIHTALLDNYSNENSLPPVYILTGKVTGIERAKLIKEIKSADAAIIISTVAKEGLDIPMVDRIYLPFPSSNPKNVQQKIGRGTRSSKDKVDSIIFDFLDINVKKLKLQFKGRANQCYRKLGIEVKL